VGEPRLPDGTWGGHPRYQCRWCQFDRLDNAGAVELHEELAHPDQVLELMLAKEKAAKTAAPKPSAPAPVAPTKG